MRWMVVTILTVVLGCSNLASEQAGSEMAALKYFDQEFGKWVARQDNDVTTIGGLGHAPPVSYEVESIVPGRPFALAFEGGKELPDDFDSWPAYRLNVLIRWKSTAETPLDKVTTYSLTWNPHEKRWYAEEDLL